ncbi:MAG: hydrogenase maturation nickel metallochaperone HypA [Desulfohalobiaceae bacterium]|nr:hydrogenase maturation nickel metallochaperone HypA [Desulfohalobiaceae bacterium]
MHELSVMQGILEVVLRHAGKSGVSRVEAVNLQVGALSHLREEWMQKYFDHLTRDSVAEGAALRVERVPAVLSCRECGARFEWEGEGSPICPSCASQRADLISGREYTVASLEAV